MRKTRRSGFVVRKMPALLAAAFAAALSACAAIDTKQNVRDAALDLKKGPETAPYRSITNFSEGLRCMDNQLLDYGVRDVSVIVEDIVDETKKVNAGTKEMLISSISDMTRRSRAIKPIAYGKDSGNTIGFLFQAQQRDHYAVVPPFGIRGAITQFDDAVVRKNLDGGISVSPYLSVGAANTATASVVGLDLSVLSTQDLSIVAGTSSRNQVIVLKEGQGLESEAAIKKFGINFSVSVARQEGLSQALRTLVELASIEVVGRLARVPYWTCLGATDADPDVQNEIRDWYDAMLANPAEMIEYFQRQMRQRKLYNGPVDGVVNPELMEAVARYREVLGMSREPKLSLDLFRAYLRADHRALAAKISQSSAAPAAAAQPAATATPVPAPAAAVTAAVATPATAAAAPLRLLVESSNNATVFKRGELVNLVVKPNRDAHVYCYLRDETARIQRFYPNRFARDSLVPAARPLQLPGAMRFQIVANNKGVRETVACFATESDVMADLPPTVAGADFDPLAVTSIEQLRAAFASTTRNSFGEGYFNVEIR